MSVKKVSKKKVTFRFEGEPGQQVFVAGSFNNWDLEESKKGSKAKKLKEEKKQKGVYSINMFLPRGEHEYKFFSEGKWFADANSQDHKLNSFGTFNSLLKVD